MRHLSHLATFSSTTNMHTKNLAIVWAPNLLRWLSGNIVLRAAQVTLSFHLLLWRLLCCPPGQGRLSRRVSAARRPSWRCASSQWWWSSSSTTPRLFSAPNSTPSYGKAQVGWRSGSRRQHLVCGRETCRNKTKRKIFLPGNNTLSRPKSLLVCSPSTKLLSLEEAQARTQAQLGSPATTPCLSHSDYIEVGEGPGALVGKFHTVIDLPMERWVKAAAEGGPQSEWFEGSVF